MDVRNFFVVEKNGRRNAERKMSIMGGSRNTKHKNGNSYKLSTLILILIFFLILIFYFLLISHKCIQYGGSNYTY